MLKHRIITAVLLLLALVAAATQLSSFYFAVFISLLVLLAAWEWAGVAGLSRWNLKLSYVFSLAFMLAALFFFLGIRPSAEELDLTRTLMILVLGLLFWLFSLLMLRDYPDNKNIWNDTSKIASMGLFALLPTWAGIIYLKYIDPQGYLPLLLIVSVAAVDVGAYFVGINFGSRKLAPKLSPHKTWEGVWGGLALCLVLDFLLIWAVQRYLFELSLLQSAFLIMLAVFVTFFSVVGDLVESMLKRNQNLKDSGSVLPGHGGILDRVDGLMGATPVFALVIMFIVSRAS